MASALAGAWWLALPLTGLAAWWATPAPWSSTVAAQAGWIGVIWAYPGAVALGEHPDQRARIAACWLGIAVLLAVVAVVNRRRGTPGY